MSCSSGARKNLVRLVGAASCPIVAILATGPIMAQGGGRVAPPSLKPAVAMSVRTQAATGKTGTQRVASDSDQVASTSIGSWIPTEKL